MYLAFIIGKLILNKINQNRVFDVMQLITSFLSDPMVGLVGYLLSFFAAIIAIYQFLGKSKFQKEAEELRLEIINLQQNIVNKNKVHQGDKSQYFQENSGSVNIDNRG